MIRSLLLLIFLLSLQYVIISLRYKGYQIRENFKLHLSEKQNYNNNNLKDNDASYDFKSLSKLAKRIDKLLSSQVDFMSAFWSDELNCFQIIPPGTDSSNSRVSITSTCLGVKAILDNPKYWSKVARWDNDNEKSGNPNIPRISFKKVVNALNSAQWSFDSFQTPLLIQTLCDLNSFNASDEKIVEAIEQLLEQRSRLSLHRAQV